MKNSDIAMNKSLTEVAVKSRGEKKITLLLNEIILERTADKIRELSVGGEL